MKERRIISLILAAVLSMGAGISVSAKFNDIPEGISYETAVDNLSGMGIINGDANGAFRPEDSITREEFTKIIVAAAGLEDIAKTLTGTSPFSDIAPDRWSTGYINAAVNEGFIRGLPDGNFHPDDSISFAQASAIMVLALKYTPADVPGNWPSNYIAKAKSLGLIDGISLESDSDLPRWAAAVMANRLLDTGIKSVDPSAEKTFADYRGSYIEIIVLGNSVTSARFKLDQVLTDKGTYYVKDGAMKLEAGYKYKVLLNDGTIVKAYKPDTDDLHITILSAVDTHITYKEGKLTKAMDLPEDIQYYYNGVKQSFANISKLLAADTGMILEHNEDGTGFVRATIIDPVYSNPEIVSGIVADKSKVGAITLSNKNVVIRDTIDDGTTPSYKRLGEKIALGDIAPDNVIYEVSDIWGDNTYILVVDHKVEGKVTGILPNPIAPKALELDSKSYDFSPTMDSGKFGTFPMNMNMGDTVTLLLGNDGKVADIVRPGDESVSDFAFVVNVSTAYSSSIEDYGTSLYTVKLMLTNGTLATYGVKEDPTYLKGTLVKYAKVDEINVVLYSVSSIGFSDVEIDKDDRQLGEYYVTDNVKIFNLISNDGLVDAKVELINWYEMPSGILPTGKIRIANQAGDFNDINILLLNDIFGEGYKTAIVDSVSAISAKTGTTYTYTLIIDGKKTTFTTSTAAIYPGKDSVVKVTMNGNAVTGLISLEIPETDSSAVIEALDAKRIKLNGKIYEFRDNIRIYTKDELGNIVLKGITSFEKGKTYGRIRVYLDKTLSSNGKVEALFITE